MSKGLYEINNHNPQSPVEALESGNIIFLPDLSFTLHKNEQTFLSPNILDPKHKNISYNILKQRINGISNSNRQTQDQISEFMQRFAYFAQRF